MDIRSGRTYETKEAALADGVPESDIAEVQPRPEGGPPKVKFSKNVFRSFKNIDPLRRPKKRKPTLSRRGR